MCRTLDIINCKNTRLKKYNNSNIKILKVKEPCFYFNRVKHEKLAH